MKAPLLGAFFMISMWSNVVWPLCPLVDDKPQSVEVTKIVDGDTVEIAGGHKIRLIGINTPEMASYGKPTQALAVEAKNQLRELLKEPPVFMVLGEEAKDRHGRLLAHLYDSSEASVSAQLLQSGVGFQVAIPPNLKHFDCFSRAEQHARERGLGVWGHPQYQPMASDSADLKAGYVRLKGRVEKVTLTKKLVWVELEGDVVLKLEKRFAPHFKGPLFDQLSGFSRHAGRQGPVLEVSGWLSDRLKWQGYMAKKVRQGKRKRFQMKVYHASNWRAVL